MHERAPTEQFARQNSGLSALTTSLAGGAEDDEELLLGDEVHVDLVRLDRQLDDGDVKRRGDDRCNRVSVRLGGCRTDRDIRERIVKASDKLTEECSTEVSRANDAQRAAGAATDQMHSVLDRRSLPERAPGRFDQRLTGFGQVNAARRAHEYPHSQFVLQHRDASRECWLGDEQRACRAGEGTVLMDRDDGFKSSQIHFDSFRQAGGTGAFDDDDTLNHARQERVASGTGRLMVRVSRETAERHRQAIVDVAAISLKRHGLDGATIPQIMADAGMTHGGFYRHFESKDELAAAAVDRAFRIQTNAFHEIGALHRGDHEAALSELIDIYLSDDHRHRVSNDCPVAALAGDVARTPDDAPVRASFSKGLAEACEAMMSLGVDSAEDERGTALAILSTMVGAILMSRASAGTELSDEILDAAREYLKSKR